MVVGLFQLSYRGSAPTINTDYFRRVHKTYLFDRYSATSAFGVLDDNHALHLLTPISARNIRLYVDVDPEAAFEAKILVTVHGGAE